MPWTEGHDAVNLGRVFEYTEQALIDQFKPGGVLDLPSLMRLPTIFMEESGYAGGEVARVGTITNARINGHQIALDFVYDPGVPPVTNTELQQFAGELGIAAPEFHRMHWAVKDADLFRVLLRRLHLRRNQPTVFRISDPPAIEPTLVAVMMPFAGFDAVYDALRATVEAVGMRCRRADEIWEAPAVMQDVATLIDKAKVVIADCTGRNPNVFYEIGIAHALGRDVIMVTQSQDDIPFDLRHLRYVRYLNNGEGLQALGAALLPRLQMYA